MDPPSSASRSQKRIVWLFLNPVNPHAKILGITLSGYDWLNLTMQEFIKRRLTQKMWDWFSFRPELRTLDLWIPNKPILWQDTSAWVIEDPKGIATVPRDLACTVEYFFGRGQPLNEPPPGVIHLLVTAERQGQRQDRDNEEERDTLSDIGLRMYQNYLATTKGSGIPSPSTAAKLSQYAELQANPQTTIYDGFYNISRPAYTSALPVEIYHPVFQRFVENVKTVQPNEELLNEVRKLMTISTGVGTVEEPLAEHLRSALTRILGKYMGQTATSGAIADSVIHKTGKNYSIPLLVMEYKRTVGEGGCDPMIQASHSAWKYWRNERLREIRDKCFCPTFIIAGGGPYLTVLGAVFTDRYIVQRLTSLEWLGMARVFEDGHLYRITQVFESLRGALRELDSFYDGLDKQDLKLLEGASHPRFYPYRTAFTSYPSKSVEEFEYCRPLAPSNKAPFLAKLKSSGDRVVVKFVTRYGAHAHQLLAEAGMAPRLLFCGSIDGQDDVRETPEESTEGVFGLHLGPLRMVVMDYIDGKHGDALEVEDMPDDTYAQVKAMVDKLHKSGYVFGDLRPPNVMFSERKAFSVDFDWAGKDGTTFYPTELGEGITKYCEGRDLRPIEKEHDLALLEHYFLQD